MVFWFFPSYSWELLVMLCYHWPNWPHIWEAGFKVWFVYGLQVSRHEIQTYIHAPQSLEPRESKVREGRKGYLGNCHASLEVNTSKKSPVLGLLFLQRTKAKARGKKRWIARWSFRGAWVPVWEWAVSRARMREEAHSQTINEMFRPGLFWYLLVSATFSCKIA